MATPAANLEVIHAYRHLYRGLLRAVQYSRPARFTARDIVRSSFRTGGANGTLDREGVRRTKWFLGAAAKERGLEHKIVKNLLRVRAEEVMAVKRYGRARHDANLR